MKRIGDPVEGDDNIEGLRIEVPSMKLMIKDHKPLGADGIPPTRPVVGASRGINVALSNILSDVLEPVAK